MPKTPICVDIDGTLIATNTLMETAIVAIKSHPLRIFVLCAALAKGKSHLKHLLGQYSQQEHLSFPYNHDVLKWLKAQRAQGRKLVLTSATDQLIAEKISQDLGIFDEIIASTIERPVDASKKYLVLKEYFQDQPFAYAGNSASDISVWNIADSAIIVHATKRVASFAKSITSIEQEFPQEERLTLQTVLREIRIHQWLKNLLVFVPAIAAHMVNQPAVILDATMAFIAFSLLASATYVFNDLLDLPADRLHQTKRLRPIASGSISIPHSIALGLSLGCAAILISLFMLPISFFGLLALYTVMNLVYTFRAKKIPYADIIILASFYVLRIIAGSAATGIETSWWLFFFAGCFFFNLASMKRTAELLQLGSEQNMVRGRGYKKRDISVLQFLGFLCIAFSCIVLALYITNYHVTTLYMRPALLWLLLPLILLWASRMWHLTLAKRMPEDPVLFASKDIPSYLIAGALFTVLLLAT